MDKPERNLHNIAVIDSSIDNYRTLVEAAEAQQMEIILISGEEGLDALAEQLEDRSDIDSLQIFSHGTQGTIYLGEDVLTSNTLSEHRSALEIIKGSLTEDGDILLYGCSVAESDKGHDFVDALALVTGADIAASDDLTGNSSQGGDWELEYQTGNTVQPFFNNFAKLASFKDVLAYSGNIDFSGNNVSLGAYSTDEAQNASFTVGNYTLVIDGQTAGTNWYGSNYVSVGVTSEHETLITLYFSNNETFDANSIYLYNWGGATDTLIVSSNKGDSTQETLDNTVGATVSLGWTGVNKIYISGNDNSWFGKLDNFNVSNVTNTSSPEVDLDANDSSTEGSGGFLTSFSEGGAPVAIADADVSVTDADSDPITTITISLTNDQDGASEGLSVSAAAQNALTGITGATDIVRQDTISITSASATLAEVQTFLQAVTYSNIASSPNTTQRTVTVVINDGTSNSTTVTAKINVADVTAAASAAASFDTTEGTNLTPAIIFGAGNETLTIASASHTSGSTIDGSGGNDELVLSDNGTNLAQATSVSGFETLSLNTDVSASMTEAQHDAFTIINGTGTNQITITDSTDGLTGDADIETYVLSTTNSFTLGAASQNITGSVGNDTIDGGALTLTGTLDGQGGTDELSLSNGASLSGATVSNIETLTIASGASVTMTEAQHDAFSTVNAAGTEQITISSAIDGLTGNANVETYVLGAANSFALGADGQSITGSTGSDTVDVGGRTLTGTLDANSGTDTLLLDNGADLSSATVSGFETLTFTANASVSMTEAQHDAFTTINGSGTEQITITAATNGFQTDADIETYILGAANAVTVTGGSQTLTGSTGNDTVTFQGLTFTGSIDAGTGTDLLQMTTGSDISGAIVSGFESLTLAVNASVTMTETQFEALSTITAAGSETITLASMDGDATITANTNIESYALGAAATLTLNADQSVTGSTGDDTVNAGAQTLTGTLDGGTGTNTLMLSNGADISAATVSNFQNLTIASGATVTMTTAQLNGFTGTITGAGTETVTLTDTGTLTGTNLGAIEILQTESGGTETITLTAAAADGKTLTATDSGTDAFVITASSGAQTLNGSAGADTIDGGAGADTIAGDAGTDTLTGGADNDEFKGSSSNLNGDTITDLSAGDSISITGVTGLSTANVRFNGNSFEIDTDATTFANPEVSINLGSDLSSVLQIASVSDSGSDTLITFASFNNQPVFSALNGTPVFTENGSAVVLDNDVTVADTELDALNAGNGNYDGASLTIARNGGASNEDTFGLSGGTLVESGDLTVSSTIIGTVTTNSAGTLVLSFNSAATSALVDQALQNITYANTSEAPGASVVLDWTFNDGAASSMGTNQTTVSITATNDAPVLDASQNPVLNGITEDAGNDNGSGADGDNDASANTDNPGTAVAALVVDNSITDLDGAAVEAIAVTAVDNTNGVWQYSTDNGSNWVNFSATTGQVVDLAANSRLLDGSLNGASTHTVRFVPDANYNGSTTLTFRAWDKTAGAAGATANTSTNGGTTAFSSATDTASVTVSSVNDAPTAADTTESMSYNASYTFTADDFGFSDVDTGDTLHYITIKTLPAAGHLTLDGLVITAVDTQVSLTQLTEGKLLFVPATNGTGDAYASFTFTVSDGTDDSVTPNTVTLNVGARPTTPPTPEPEPEPQPESEEDLVTSPTGVSGDGNDDGVPDRDQADVASIPFRDTPVPSQEPNADPIYVSLTGGTTDGKSSATGSGVTLSNVRQLDKPDDDEAANLDMPLGLIAFDADIEEVGGTETFSLYVDDTLSINGYWKQNASGKWVNLASKEYGGKVVLEGSKLRLDFQITDGGEFDKDGEANGTIVDPGALAFGSEDYSDLVQSLYIAYYQRPADSGGLDYWVDYLIGQDGSLENVVDAFANSAESQALYGEITNTSISGFLGDLYRALFDRSPEVDGLMFYRNAFLAGEYEDGRPATAGTLMLDILQGAQNSDAELVELKLEAARTFTWLLDPDQDGEVMATFDASDLNDVRDWLQGLAGSDTAPGVGAIYSLIKDEVAEYGEPITLTGANGATELLF